MRLDTPVPSVIHLGTNGDVNSSDLTAMMDALAEVPQVLLLTIVRTMCFTSQPLSMNSFASQSSRSGCVGYSPCAPKSSAVRTSPLPK